MTSTAINGADSAARIRQSSFARWLAFEATVPAVLFASAAIVLGLHWDIAWHRSIGRDTFWSPPHVLEQVAAAMAGLFCGWRVIYTSFFGTDADRAGAVRWWGAFYGPLGGWVCIWGTIAMITSAPFDDWWHAAYGLDVKILTPPHVFLLVGMITIQLGAMLMMLTEQNAATAAAGRRWVFPVSMGLVVLMAATMVFAETGLPNLQHRPNFYQVTGAMLPLFLVAVARSARVRFPATIAALTYMVLLLVSSWILILIPATPKLAPIYNAVTHLTPPGFPILLVVPALAIDWLLARRAGGNDWITAPLVGVAFVALLGAVQWPFSSFLLSLEQPNYLFATGYWSYQEKLGSWTTTFFDVPGFTWSRAADTWVGSLDYGILLVGLGWAVLFATISARLGLWWGSWMTRVRR